MATDTHISRAVCQVLSGMTRQKVAPENIVVFTGIKFGASEVTRKFNPDDRSERPARKNAFIAYTEHGEPLLWAMDNFQPVPGKTYNAFTLLRCLDRDGRRNLEIPVIADPKLLGLSEKIKGSLVTETILQEVVVFPRSDPQILGFGTNGKLVRVKRGATLPLNERRPLLVSHNGLEEVDVFALAEATLEQTNDPLVVEVNNSLWRWPDQLGIDEGTLLSLTMEEFEATVNERLYDIRDAFGRVVKQDRRLRGFKDEAAETKTKTEKFERLIILEACAEAGKKWIARRDAEAPAKKPPAKSKGNGKSKATTKNATPAAADSNPVTTTT